MLFWSSILWLVFEQRGGRKREWGKKNSFTNPHCFKMSEHFFRIPEPFLWKNSCFLKPFNCVVQRSRVWKNLYSLWCLKCVLQKSSALPWYCLYWIAKLQSQSWAVCQGIFDICGGQSSVTRLSVVALVWQTLTGQFWIRCTWLCTNLTPQSMSMWSTRLHQRICQWL